MIDISTLKESDKNRPVFYKLFEQSEPSYGHIISWDKKYILVSYADVKKPQKTNPEDLYFMEIKVITNPVKSKKELYNEFLNKL